MGILFIHTLSSTLHKDRHSSLQAYAEYLQRDLKDETGVRFSLVASMIRDYTVISQTLNQS